MFFCLATVFSMFSLQWPHGSDQIQYLAYDVGVLRSKKIVTFAASNFVLFSWFLFPSVFLSVFSQKTPIIYRFFPCGCGVSCTKVFVGSSGRFMDAHENQRNIIDGKHVD